MDKWIGRKVYREFDEFDNLKCQAKERDVRWADRQIDRQLGILIVDKQTDRQADRQSNALECHKGRQTDRHTEMGFRQSDRCQFSFIKDHRQIDRQKDRQIDRRTDGQTDRQKKLFRLKQILRILHVFVRYFIAKTVHSLCLVTPSPFSIYQKSRAKSD